jgi:hypothetical protein
VWHLCHLYMGRVVTIERSSPQNEAHQACIVVALRGTGYYDID